MRERTLEEFDWTDPNSRPANSQGHGGIVVPSPLGKIAQLEHRIVQLERRIIAERQRTPRETLKFSAPGTVALNAEGVDTPRVGTLITDVELVAVTAASSQTTVTIYQNGLPIGTVALAASASGPVIAHAAIPVAPGVDRVGAKVTELGTGLGGLTINVHLL